MSIYELPVGHAICPYHFEWTDEERLIVSVWATDAYYVLRRSDHLDYWDGEGN